ncbi:heavy metal translocating P-type ATPase (plasmid) [Cupriavidus pinatubonensis]|uniref:heavy metal translocating P-type ATPase n=1 Tax=Cupriavidus pinatubonensis TaxID=248026 RepID=UPI001C73067B|nr:heavy metal translocating P-type ATPase [Cupriavidus pinatubonensis]QYY33682.1 heavy metal translocating P-type ATPase [Cupriavidus pinatubonensis]
MRFGSRFLNTALLVNSVVTLGAGLLASRWNYLSAAAIHVIWLLGVVPILVALSAAIVRAALRRQQGVDILAFLSIGFSLGMGEFLVAAVIALMLASGRALESFAEARAQREMTALLSHAPKVAHRFQDGQWQQVGLETVQAGDRLLVRHGELVPVDGTPSVPVELDESALTGESVVQHRVAGNAVCSGVLNVGAAFEMVASAPAERSTFAGIVRMVGKAQAERSPSARLADRYALAFVFATVLLAAAGWIVSGDPARCLAVLVVATPCPLILAVPVAIVSGLSRCARRGVLVKGGGALERLAVASILFFDKTGTLTGGHARLVDVACAEGHEPEEVLRLAGSLAQASNHVISEAVTLASRERGISLQPPSQVVESPGAGVRGVVNGRTITVGSPSYVLGEGEVPAWCTKFLERLGYEGASAVFVGADGRVIGALQMVDRIRLETPRALRLLRQEGIVRQAMLTGDRQDVAESVGAMLGVTEVYAAQTPGDKLSAIHAARANGTVIMVGDGVNDAPALAAADVGVAMGARGAAASAEAADVVVLVDRLDRLVDAVRIARRARRIAIQSVGVGMALSLVAMAAALFGYLPPLAGAMLQEAIDVLVIVNALRVLRAEKGGVTPRLPAVDVERLKAEHAELEPILDRVRALADALPRVTAEKAAAELTNLSQTLNQVLVPHERRDDTQLYPGMARLLGGDDPLAALSGMHREIFRVTRLLDRIVANLPSDGPDETSARELQRLLYGLDAILRLHCAQEDELYFVLGGQG